MPSITHPPSTWRRFAAASALLLFLLLPTPPSSAAAQPASIPASGESSSSTPAKSLPPILSVLWALSMVTAAISYFFSFLLCVIFFYRYIILQTPLLSDDNDILGFGPVGTPVAFTAFGFFLIFIFLLILVGVVIAVIYGPVPTEYRTGHPLRHEGHCLRAPCGLNPAVIKTFPTVIYSAVKGHKISEASLECAVCLNYFEDDDTLRLIPKCNHVFHLDCIGKWLASHTTCPVCRANLTSQQAGSSASQLPESGTEPPRVEVTVEATLPNGGAPERSPREGQRQRIHPPDLWDKNESGSFNNRNRTGGSGRIRRFPRSHSTGHSLVRPSEDTERFTLRMSAEVSKQLMDRPGPVLPPEGCSRRGYRCGVEGSSPRRYFGRPDWLDRATKSERWDFNRISPILAANDGGRSSPGSVEQARPAI
ncbi:putative RING-H2 finger protein ATL37 [Syzygium oleosum]|uniref:putative RING-H2 finger protein ATL37 n=1 Tax=Syzygium oleosum TaxID=219896 RepID=UPI0011D21E61|nr:putative RING-H2 finger protein ATL37 [Syzygium oleosum]